MAEFASKGVAGSGLGLGIAGTALGLLNGGLGNLLGNQSRTNDMVIPMVMASMNRSDQVPVSCSENQPVTRYELAMQNEIASKDGKIALLEANTYADQKILEVYKYFDGEIKRVDKTLCEQAVFNATQVGAIGCIKEQVAQLQGLTKLIVPITSVCPEPMKAYNSWTAPTAQTTPTTGA